MSNDKPLQAIIFDLGGVLIGWDPRKVFSRFFPGQTGAMEDFLEEVHFAEWNAQQDKGRPFAEGVALHAEKFPHHAHLIQAYHENWKDSLTGSLEGSVEILRTLKKEGWRLYGLSNWSAETFPMAQYDYGFLSLLEDIVISGDVKMIKPEPEIFHYLLKRINLQPGECLFIDDSPANIETAKRLGFQTILFHSPSQLAEELIARQILKETHIAHKESHES